MRDRPGCKQWGRFSGWMGVVSLFLLLIPASGYPVILAVDEGEEERCLAFSIPEDDDAHVIIMALPDEELMPSEDVESWYIEQIYAMTKLKSQKSVIPRSIPNELPDKVAGAVSNYLKEHGGNQAPVKITVQVQSYDEDLDQRNYKTKYFIPLVLNHVRKHHSSKRAENFEGVNICFSSTDNDGRMINMVVDMILMSEDVPDLDVKPKEPGFEKEQHLSPLEKSLDQSITAARSVLKEYKYMEQREARMRQTAEGINSRVHYFSYISVAILFGVTYLQVGYLKRYFKKKKLM